MSDKPSFFAELKRRNVYKVAVAYAIVAWLLIQIATQVFPFFEVPNWGVRLVVLLIAIGFPIALVLAWAFELTPEGIKRSDAVAPNESITHHTGRKLTALTVIVAVVAAILLLFQLARHKPAVATGNPTAASIVPKAAGEVIPEKSIAVLPLANSTGDPANEYFSDGMSEELISSLSRLSGIKVIGRTSSFQFKGKTEDSKAIGEKLGVAYLLDGSVRKSSDRVRISVALVRSADGANVWSETYDRELKDIFAVQSEIAGTVASQLQVALLDNNAQTAQQAAAAVPSNQNVEAYTALLQGNFYLQRRTAEDYRKAIAYYEEAIRLDPRYALAYAKLSIAARQEMGNFSGIVGKEGKEAVAKARAAAETALHLDPNLAEAHRAQGLILERIDFNFVGAEAECSRAVELAPQDSGPVQALANLKASLGRLDEAVALTQRAIALDPLRSASYYDLALYLTPLGRYDEAEAALRKAIELQPRAAQNYGQLAIIQILRGQSAAAVELAKQETDPFWSTYALALAYHAHGSRAEADAALQKLIDEDAEDAGTQIATVYALRKAPDKVFEWLEHAWATHDGGVAEILNNPFLLAYKNDPRFTAFAKKIGVMPETTR